MTFKLVECSKKNSQAETGKKEWNAESERIRGQQNDSFTDGILLAGNGKNCGKDRSDARCPAESKCQPDEESAEKPQFFSFRLKSFFVIQKRNFIDSNHMNAENDNDNAGNLADDINLRMEELSDKCCRRSEADKDKRKTEDKKEGVQ